MSSRVVFFVRWFRKFYRPVSQILKRPSLALESLEARLVPDGQGFSQLLPQWNGNNWFNPPAAVAPLTSNTVLVPLVAPSPPSSGPGTVPSAFSNFSYPTTLPTATVTPTLATSILSGNYQRHYTLNAQTPATASTPSGQVFLDVQIVSAVQFGSTSVTESGTLTVSQTVLQNGTLISQIVSSVIPFSQTVPEDTNGLHYFGLDGGDGAPGYTSSGLLNSQSQTSWNQLSWSDSAAFLTMGSWTYSDNTTLGLCSIDQSSLSYTSTTSTLSGGTKVSTDTTSTSWQSQFTISDQPANIPTILLTQNTVLPAVLGPVTNTHLYLQSRDSGTSQETLIETTPAAGSSNPGSTVSIASSYSGADSFRYFSQDSVTALITPKPADPVLNTPAQPFSGYATISWLMDTQTSGTYSGSTQGNFTLATPTSPIGTLTYNDIRHDTTTTDTLNLSEEIFLTDNDTQYFEQTALQQSLTQPLLEDSTLTQTLGYDLPLIVGPVIDSQIVSNTLAYSYSASQGAIQSSITDQYHLRSNTAATSATTTTPATPASYLTLSGYSSASGSDQSQGTVSGTYDLIHDTQTVNDNLSYQSHWVSTDFGTLGYNENGTIPVALRSLSFSQSQTDSSGNSTLQGGFDATGKQISGISQSHDQSTTTIPQFWSWSQLSGVNQPTLTEYQAGGGQEVFTSNSNLAFASDGKATGTFDLSLVSGVASSITSALIGTLYLDPGTGNVSGALDATLGTSPTNTPRDSITFNDQSQSLIQAGTVFQTQFAWASDVPTGTVLLGQSAQITSNSLDNRAFVSNHGKDHAQYDATDGGQIRINDHVMSTIAGDLVTTTASTATSIHYAGQSQLIADGKLDAAATGQKGEYHLEERTRYRIQGTESIQSLWANDAWNETGHNFTVDHEAHDAWIYNQTVNLPKNSDPIITTNPDGSTSSQIIRLEEDQSTVTSGGGYDYHLVQSGSPSDFVFTLNHTSQSQSGKHDTGTWRAADGSSGSNYDNLGSETKGSRANLSGRVQNGSVYYTGIDVYQTRNTSTNNTGSGFALGQTTNSHTVGSTQTTETRGGNSGSWYGSKLESGNSTTNYTTVSGTMGQPFSGMTQTGFNTTTMYGASKQTGPSGMYGYGQTGTGGSYNTLSTSPTIAPPEPADMPTAPGRPSYQIAGGPSGSKPGVVSGLLTPVSEQTSGLPVKVKDFDNGGETLGGQQKKRFSEVNQAAKDAFLREENRFPARSLPIEPERTKTEYFARYGTLSKEPNSALGLESFILDFAIQSIIETGTAIYQTGLYLFDSFVILGEGGLTGLTYLYGGTENAYQHRYSPKSTVYNQLFSGKITTGQAILMVEMNYGVTVLTLSPLARLGRVPKPGAANAGGIVAPNRKVSFGIEQHLDDFSRNQGADSWKVWAKGDPMAWKGKFYDVMNDKKSEILFNLDGVDVWGGVTRASRNAGGATDWELLQIYSNKEWWSRIKWIKEGKPVPNPFK